MARARPDPYRNPQLTIPSRARNRWRVSLAAGSRRDSARIRSAAPGSQGVRPSTREHAGDEQRPVRMALRQTLEMTRTGPSECARSCGIWDRAENACARRRGRTGHRRPHQAHAGAWRADRRGNRGERRRGASLGDGAPARSGHPRSQHPGAERAGSVPHPACAAPLCGHADHHAHGDVERERPRGRGSTSVPTIT